MSEKAMGPATHVVNLIGILHERETGDFDRLQGALPGRIARCAAEKGVRALVHLSAIGASEDSKSSYARSKARGETAVAEAYPAAAILRPSVVFGPGDGFFTRFGEMAAMSPMLPLVNGGHTRFQPVYVGDVADAVLACLDNGESGVFELGGPEVATFRELLEYLLEVLGRKRLLLPVSAGLLQLPARICEKLPDPPLTRDQLLLLDSDNVVAEGARKLADLGIQATPMQVVVPGYARAFARKQIVAPAA